MKDSRSSVSDYNVSSFSFPSSSSSSAQTWESSCSQEGEMGHIFLICLCNLSLKWVRRFPSIPVCAPGATSLWAGLGRADAPSLGKIREGRIDLYQAQRPSVEFWWPCERHPFLWFRRGGGRQNVTHKQMCFLSWWGLIIQWNTRDD